jgi:hypothetical protein
VNLTPPSPLLLLGTHAYPASGEAAVRQDAALDALRQLRGVRLVNVQFADAPFVVAGFDTRADLVRDSRTVTGREGPRKPIATDLFDSLAAAAVEAGARRFAFANADVVVSQALVDRVAGGRHQAVLAARTDVDPADGREVGVNLEGVDVFVVETDWWRGNRRRFRPYLAGEPVWDNVYAAQLLCHADGVLLTDAGLARHTAHPTAWTRSPFGRYVQLLVALDAPYFSIWCRYHWELTRLRAAGGSEADERALQQAIFRWAPSWNDRVVHAGRAAVARVRYAVSASRA